MPAAAFAPERAGPVWAGLPPGGPPGPGSQVAREPARLAPGERHAVTSARWFASLPPALRHDILVRAVVRRYRHGWACALRGSPADAWFCVARGAVRLSSGGSAGRAFSLDYLKPGQWFADDVLGDAARHTLDAQAHGDTTLLCVVRADFEDLRHRHPALADALLRLNASRLRALCRRLDEMASLPLATRLARQLQRLQRGFGLRQDDGVRIGLRLAQDELAQLLGASRQRVNVALQALVRDGVVALDARGIVVRDDARLAAAAHADGAAVDQSPTRPLRMA